MPSSLQISRISLFCPQGTRAVMALEELPIAVGPAQEPDAFVASREEYT